MRRVGDATERAPRRGGRHGPLLEQRRAGMRTESVKDDRRPQAGWRGGAEPVPTAAVRHNPSDDWAHIVVMYFHRFPCTPVVAKFSTSGDRGALHGCLDPPIQTLPQASRRRWQTYGLVCVVGRRWREG